MLRSRAAKEGWEDEDNSTDKNAVGFTAIGEADVKIIYFNFSKII